MNPIATGQITSADDGTNIPNDNGFTVSGSFNFLLAGGSSFSGALQRKTAQGNWVTAPDSQSRTTLAGAAYLRIRANRGDQFRVSVTSATGTWDWEVINADESGFV